MDIVGNLRGMSSAIGLGLGLESKLIFIFVSGLGSWVVSKGLRLGLWLIIVKS